MIFCSTYPKIPEYFYFNSHCNLRNSSIGISGGAAKQAVVDVAEVVVTA